MSYKLWLPYRDFPIISPFDFLYSLPGYIHAILYAASVSIFIITILKPRRIFFLKLLFVSELLSCLIDITRWQPWQFQYMFVALAFIFYTRNNNRLHTALVIILASTYVYSGLHKCNGGFLYSVWNKMILVKTGGLMPVKNIYTHYSGLLIPCVEILAGILLITKYRRFAAIAIICTHIFILILIGPAGSNYNNIVWPWNFAMILLVYYMFIKGNNLADVRFLTGNSFGRAIILFWVILPAFSFAGLWDNYLSSSLYSGNLKHLALCITGKPDTILEEHTTKKDKYKICNGNLLLSVNKWSLAEMNVPAYPEIWYYRKFKARFKMLHPQTNAEFIIYSYPYKNHYKLEQEK